MRILENLGSMVGLKQHGAFRVCKSGLPSRCIHVLAFLRWRNAVCWMALLLSTVLSSHAQTVAREHEVKATLLFNFCHFVEWPATAFADPTSPFVIGILGDDPFGKFIDDLIRQEKAHGRVIEIRRLTRFENPSSVHLLYISRSEQSRNSAVLEGLKGRPVLTIGESLGFSFARKGGMIEFFTVRDSIKLRINLDEARASGLTVSAKLLRLAELVRTE